MAALPPELPTGTQQPSEQQNNPDPTKCWKRQSDPTSGQLLYVHSITGHSTTEPWRMVPDDLQKYQDEDLAPKLAEPTKYWAEKRSKHRGHPPRRPAEAGNTWLGKDPKIPGRWRPVCGYCRARGLGNCDVLSQIIKAIAQGRPVYNSCCKNCDGKHGKRGPVKCEILDDNSPYPWCTIERPEPSAEQRRRGDQLARVGRDLAAEKRQAYMIPQAAIPGGLPSSAFNSQPQFTSNIWNSSPAGQHHGFELQHQALQAEVGMLRAQVETLNVRYQALEARLENEIVRRSRFPDPPVAGNRQRSRSPSSEQGFARSYRDRSPPPQRFFEPAADYQGRYILGQEEQDFKRENSPRRWQPGRSPKFQAPSAGRNLGQPW